MDAAVGILLVAVLAAAFVWSLRDAARNPQRYRGVMNSRRRWRRAQWWILAVTAAAVVGVALAGASEYVTGAIAVTGFALSCIAADFAGAAWLNARLRRFFGD